MDRERVGLTPEVAIALMIVVDGEPMFLPLTVWDTRLDAPPYTTTAPIYATLAAPTTLDQIHRIAAAENIEMHIIAKSDAVRYQTWHGDWESWLTFPPEN